MKKLLFLLMIVPLTIIAQEEGMEKNVISFSPQYLIKYGIRIDYERKMTSNKWLVLAPQLYISEKSAGPDELYFDSEEFNLLAGLGLATYVKNYSKRDGNFGSYLSYGPVYNYFYTEYYEEVDGETEPATANINRFGFDIILGYQFKIKQVAIVDVYTGMGIRKSLIDNGGFSNEKFSSYPLGFNMTGNLLLLGIKIGLAY